MSVEQPATRRPGSKRARLIELLSREQGATLADLMAVTGWLPHTTRAALTGLRQGGYTIERSTGADHDSVYRITAAHAWKSAGPRGVATSV
jgi:DNA-binding IclR family transcriptional regulator